MTLKLYYDLMSQPSRALVIFLQKNQVPFADQALALRRNEHLDSDYHKINPFKLVPAISDDGFTLTESSTILKYIADKYLPEESHYWYPKDLKKRAKADEYLDWHHFNTRANCSSYFRNRLLRPVANNAPVDMKKVENYQANISKVMSAIDSYFLQDRKFMLGNEISIADLQAVCEIEQVLAAGLDPLAQHPRLVEWAQHVRDFTNPHYQDASKILYAVTARLKQRLEEKNKEAGK